MTTIDPQLETPPPISAVERDAITRSLANIKAVMLTVEGLPRHRMYSLAITKLEEASLWLRERLRHPTA